MMCISLEERKRNFAKQLQEDYADKPRRWWQSKKFDYKSTWERGNQSSLSAPAISEVVVRFNYRLKVAGAILMFLGNFIFLIPISKGEGNNFLYFFALIWNFLLAYIIKTALDRKPKIIINDEGLWLHSIKITFSWNSIVATYIKEDLRGENTAYYLLVHYYDEFNDCFTIEQFSLDTYDVSHDDIAFYIEYWKNKIGYPSVESQNS